MAMPGIIRRKFNVSINRLLRGHDPNELEMPYASPCLVGYRVKREFKMKSVPIISNDSTQMAISEYNTH